MPQPESMARRVLRRLSWAVRDTWPERRVVREVQGVRMTLPWSHRLPDYTKHGSLYGQNLVRLAELLTPADEPLTVLDVGANIGDSALQILAATDARVLCVEADGRYLEYLRLNLGEDPRAEIEACLLTTAAGSDPGMAPVRSGGTTRFEVGSSAETAPPLSAAELRRRHPSFDGLRLVKSDTDGYDVHLVPALAETWSDVRPVLFFEYDHRLSRLAGFDPVQVWPALEKLGYGPVAIWDNGGTAMRRLTVDQMPGVVEVLDAPVGRRAEHYWDVAVAHVEDTTAHEAFAKLVP